MKANLPILLFLGSLLFFSCTPRTPFYDYSKEPDPRRSEYVIGVSDGIRIDVWNNRELGTQATVRPDGTITMPLVGDLRAVGRTPSQLKDEISQRLSQFIKDESAVVTVAITAVNSYHFTVTGNVERAGVFTSPRFLTVAEALALAGGPNRFATPERTVLVRTDSAGNARKIPINLKDVATGQRLEQNLVLLPGDTIFVP
ncbi:MAG: polysaccharide biosynthesis/export family protein [Deltaproteobacteria bacterium]|nr:polysaccharide biosynthesis/export family protein [Deltaproteobacteria bacterium]